MRATLIIFAVIGICAIGLLVVIGSGLVHLSSLDALAATPGISPSATQPLTGPDDDDPDNPDTGPADPAATQSVVIDRSVFLSASDATITGPKIALMLRDNVPIKTGDGQPAAALPPEFMAFGRNRAGHWGGRRRPPPAPFIDKWGSPDDRAEWDFVSPAAAKYTVSFVYSGPHAGREDAEKTGGPFIVAVGNQELRAAPKATTSSTGFELTDVGTLTLPAGPVHLSVRPQGKINYDNSIRLRSVRLFPSKE